MNIQRPTLIFKSFDFSLIHPEKEEIATEVNRALTQQDSHNLIAF